MFISNKIIEDIIQHIKKTNSKIVFIEDSVFGNLVKTIRKECQAVKVVTFYHDIKANLYLQWIKDSPIQDKIEFRIGIYQEKINQEFANVNLVFNERDAKLFEACYGKRPEGIIALPAPIVLVDETYKNSITKINEKKSLLFVGKKYGPNIDGLNWFVENVLPKLSNNLQLDIVGRGLESLKDKYSDSRINIIGGVESLTSYYKKADIVIAPLFNGGGMKSKTVEAISFGKIFVGTEESLFGFWEEMDDTIREKTVYQCNSAEEWISTINMLVESEISKYSDVVYRLFLEKFSYEANREKLRKIMMEE